MIVIPEDGKFQAILGYIGRPRLKQYSVHFTLTSLFFPPSPAQIFRVLFIYFLACTGLSSRT